MLNLPTLILLAFLTNNCFICLLSLQFQYRLGLAITILLLINYKVIYSLVFAINNFRSNNNKPFNALNLQIHDFIYSFT